MSDGRRKLTGWLKQAIRLLILALVAWGIWNTVDGAQEKFAEADLSITDLRPGWLLLAGCCYAAGSLPSALFWFRTLQAMGQQPRLFETLRAFFAGHLGKYVPGKALVVIIRTSMISGPRVDTAVAATSVFIETLTMMAVGATVAALLIGTLFREQWELLLLAIVLALAAGLPTVPPLFVRIVRLLKVDRAQPQVEEAIGGVDYRLMGFGWLSISLGWLCFGLSLWATMNGMPGAAASVTHLPLLTATVALAMVAGFLSLLPGGIGVRELVVMTLLSPQFGPVAAIVSAVILRLVWLAAELVVAGVLYVGIRVERDVGP